jgi:preprotein translocase subunit YajC
MPNDLGWIVAQASSPAESPAPAAAPAQQGAPQTTTQTTAPGDQTVPPADQQKPKGLFDNMLLPIVLMFVVLYFFVLRGPRKKQQQHKQMLDNLKKNDKIRTIGGIIGTVVDVRDNEVVVKIDESNNTKMHVIRSAIGEVFAENKSE